MSRILVLSLALAQSALAAAPGPGSGSRTGEGELRLDVAEDDAAVLVDGTVIARGPYRDALRLPPGTYRVAVRKRGYVAWESEVRVGPGETAEVAPRLAEVAPRRAGDGPWYAAAGLSWIARGVPEPGGSGWRADGPPDSSRSVVAGWRASPSLALEVAVDHVAVARRRDLPGGAEQRVATASTWVTGGAARSFGRHLAVAASVAAGATRVGASERSARAAARLDATSSAWGAGAGAELRLALPLGIVELGLTGGASALHLGPPVQVGWGRPATPFTIGQGWVVLPRLGAFVRLWI